MKQLVKTKINGISSIAINVVARCLLQAIYNNDVGYVVFHHKDLDNSNNSPDNIILILSGAHTFLHSSRFYRYLVDRYNPRLTRIGSNLSYESDVAMMKEFIDSTNLSKYSLEQVYDLNWDEISKQAHILSDSIVDPKDKIALKENKIGGLIADSEERSDNLNETSRLAFEKIILQTSKWKGKRLKVVTPKIIENIIQHSASNEDVSDLDIHTRAEVVEYLEDCLRDPKLNDTVRVGLQFLVDNL